MNSFCFFVGIDIQAGDEKGQTFLKCDNPILIQFDQSGVTKYPLYPVMENYLGKPIISSIFYYTKDIFQVLENLFPVFEGKKIKAIFEDNIGYIRDNWDDEKWDKDLEPMIVEIIIINLLKDGWKLFDKDGLWFVK